ncbi:FAD-binding and (Fe-S)-binding domain-containing protein [Chitinophaga japonensis]|uniref:FAD/FMN-containing dehydrogenase n=1 Tax=Chitinophaga japonensis TaxID=104662 RepID=A0A562ST78_CHIJA|nr:FAD-binding and (Fe-S)-binding domain-containing protein [Chitinophaga japonensis]TWI84455.1 FAD/FMN-containing dehydrogenase [Chitinophaga japonensis]
MEQLTTQPRFNTRFRTKYAAGVDAAGLEQWLKERIKGEVRFDDGSKALYATDASNYRQVPVGVVLPQDEEDIVHTIAACRRFNAPVLNRGGGTSLAGQCCNVAVVIDQSKYYNKVLQVDKDQKLVKVQAGIVLDHMRQHTEEKAGLTFGPDPATHNHCTIGGMVGNNSCGVHSIMAARQGNGARTSDNVERMTVLTYDGLKMEVGPTPEPELERIIAEGGPKGEIYRRLKALADKYAPLIRERFPHIPRRVSGYNLPALLPENGFNVAHALSGTEGTCVTVLDATMKLLDAPRARVLTVLGYPDVYTAGRAVPEVMSYEPIGLEGIDGMLISFMKRKGLNLQDLPLLPEGNGWLLVEFGGASVEEADKKARTMIAALKKKADTPDISLIDDPEQAQMIWEIRESGLGATAWVPGEPMTNPGWEDTAVPPERIGDYLQDLRRLFQKYDLNPSLYGHFGQGCVHCRVAFDLLSEQGLEQYRQFTREGAELVKQYGGSISGEHGDGQARGDLLEIMYGPELMEAFHEFKSIWDPQDKMNPGKVLDTYGQTANLRLGTQYNPASPRTQFHYPADNGRFSRATLRCVGVGKCRRHDGGTMCPSFMVTGEEMHSTRGRAHLLNEMLQGDIIKDGWKDPHVKEALDLCLSCKGCKGDCPVNVDIATYKAEFLSHYYKGRLRPRSAYAFGLIPWWARLASLVPAAANFVMRAPGIGRLLKAAGDIAPQRDMPAFAGTTFREWFGRRNREKAPKHKKVILWTDTFNNFFLPQTLVAATEVLEAAGFEVLITRRLLCCGRPLYDFGMLGTAKHLLQQILAELRTEIRQGIPIVGLEPSCVSVFRDELTDLLPGSEDARRLKKQTCTLAEFLDRYAEDFQLPPLKRNAILHGHCHQKAVLDMKSEVELLNKMGLELNVLDAGCCGIAGYFGYKQGAPYDVSVKLGERVLLPAVREAGKDAIIIADGFSCRGQIEQGSDRKGMHLAQVLQMALHEQHGRNKTKEKPERIYVDKMQLRDQGKTAKNLLLAAAVAGLTLAGCVLSANGKQKQ